MVAGSRALLRHQSDDRKPAGRSRLCSPGLLAIPPDGIGLGWFDQLGGSSARWVSTKSTVQEQPARGQDQIKPSFIFPSSEIIDWFHGGSQVMRTSASLTPGTRRIFDLASSAIAGPMPQPGAVSVMATLTL